MTASQRFKVWMSEPFAPNARSDIRAHLPMLYDAARGKRVIELGVGDGTSTSAFLTAMERHGGHLLSVDINVGCFHFPGHPCWTFHASDSLNADIAPTGLPAYDVLFIDTDHSYERTLAELRLWSQCIRPDGVIFLHDIENPLYPGVRQAVAEFTATSGIVATIHRGSFGMAELRSR